MRRQTPAVIVERADAYGAQVRCAGQVHGVAAFPEIPQVAGPLVYAVAAFVNEIAKRARGRVDVSRLFSRVLLLSINHAVPAWRRRGKARTELRARLGRVVDALEDTPRRRGRPRSVEAAVAQLKATGPLGASRAACVAGPPFPVTDADGPALKAIVFRRPKSLPTQHPFFYRAVDPLLPPTDAGVSVRSAAPRKPDAAAGLTEPERIRWASVARTLYDTLTPPPHRERAEDEEGFILALARLARRHVGVPLDHRAGAVFGAAMDEHVARTAYQRRRARLEAAAGA